MGANDNIKESFNNIPIPETLESCINKSIKKGVKDMERSKYITRFIVTAASFLIIFTSLAIGINAVPALAEQLNKMPGGSNIIRALQLKKNSVEGGEVTDGKDIKSIDKEETDISERITIKMGGTDGSTTKIGYYKISYQTHPFSALVYLSGVRAFRAMEDVIDITAGKLVEEAYPLITLDDSAHRFVITFKKPVTIEVIENNETGELVMVISEDKDTPYPEPIYSLRSKALPLGEEVATIEEMLLHEYESGNTRTIRDQHGSYFVEEGAYQSESDAIARKTELSEMGANFELFIEKRNASSAQLE